MAGGGGRSLEETPTWAVAVVCFVLLAVSIFIEHLIHLVGKWLAKRNKKAIYEALEKIKSELMLLGFISLMLTVTQGTIADICIPESVGNSWLPCHDRHDDSHHEEFGHRNYDGNGRRRLLEYLHSRSTHRRFLASEGYDKCAEQGKVSLVSYDGIHQLHIFIFVLAVFHVLCCINTLVLGRLKMKSWKAWETETRTTEYQSSKDPERFRFARDTSFGRRHLSSWSKFPILIWVVCFFRQFVRSVPKVDYVTLRHGFITAHLAPQSRTNFDFHKYIKRSLEEDFKVVVGISPPIWFFVVLFLLLNTHGWLVYLWLPFAHILIMLLVGTKLQVIITKMGLRIQDRGEMVKGTPVVQPADELFWFNRPRFLLYLIQFVLFQNAFQLAFSTWAWYEYGMQSCFQSKNDVIVRLSMGVLVQILCSYVTLPLYALVTQMGSNMKPTVFFNDRVATALRTWHHTARKQIKNQQSGSVTSMSSRASTPPTNLSPLRLLPYYKTESGLSNNNHDDDSSSQQSETHVPIEVEGKAGEHQATHLADFSSHNDSRV